MFEKSLCLSAEQAQKLILSGLVMVDGNPASKPGQSFSDSCSIVLKEKKEFVGRGAYKLLSAFDNFSLNVNQKICADVGSSTGGFTEVLLAKGASKVYAIDVGYGELDWKLRSNSKVVVMERTNARYLESLPEKAEFITIDVSFISLKLIIPSVLTWLAEGGQILALIKPQFEAEKSEVGKGGVIKDPNIHNRIVSEMADWLKTINLRVLGSARSGLEGAKGNKEFFIWCSL